MPCKQAEQRPFRASRLAQRLLLAGVCATAFWAGAMTPLQAFHAENDVAMRKMMAGMHAESSGDIDRDFALMMIAHHQGAIDMAVAQLRYGTNEQLRRLAQEIIVEQTEEIAAMRAAIGLPLPAPAPVPTMPTPRPHELSPSTGHTHHH